MKVKNESQIAGITILIVLSLMPIGFIIFGSRFIGVAPIVVVIGISIFAYIAQKKRRQKKLDLKRIRDEVLSAKWEEDMKNR